MSLSIFNILNRIFFPNRCYVCGGEALDRLCTVCRPLCRLIEANHGPVKSAFHYDDTIRTLMLGAKVLHQVHFAHLLADLFKEALPKLTFYPELLRFAGQGIVIVPGGAFVLYQRGFDINILLAKALADLIDAPLVPLLNRSRAAIKLARIDNKQERFQAIQGTFSLAKHKNIERLILLDDIVTTGATLQEAKKTLAPLKAKIFALTAAKTPF